METKLGTNTPSTYKLGSEQVDALYLGTNKVFTNAITYSDFSGYNTPTGFTALNLNQQRGGRNYGRPHCTVSESDTPTVVQKLLNALRGCDYANVNAKVFYKYTVSTSGVSRENLRQETVCGDHGNGSSGIVDRLPYLEYVEEIIYWDTATVAIKHFRRISTALCSDSTINAYEDITETSSVIPNLRA